MAKDTHGVSSKRPRKLPHKTAKRRAAKQALIATKAAARRKRS